jgi:hypothetical protein
MRLAGASLVCACLLVLGAAQATVARGEGVLTPPSADPFYVPPSGFGHAADGDVLAARPITATAFAVPLPVHAWQLLYRSTTSGGAPTADVTTVIVPVAAWPGPGPRPVVSYQTAEDSVGSRCAPSYVIRSGVLALDSNAQGEVGLIAGLLLKGWAVVTPDYEGPQSEVLVGAQEGPGVLDGIRAALAYGPDGLRTSPVALWGYSGGAFASAWAAELAPRYAPGLRFAGIALGGDPDDLLRSYQHVDGTYGAGLLFGGIIGLLRAYPDAGIGAMFTAAGQQALAASSEDCTDELLLQYPFRHLADFTYDPHPLSDSALTRALVLDSPLGKGTPSGQTPIYDYHSMSDELVPVAVDDDLVAAYCAAGVAVDRVRYTYGDHISTLLTGAGGAEQFLSARFAAQPIDDTCPARPPGATAPLRRQWVITVGRRRQVRPATIALASHPSAELRALVWRHWGGGSATATGRLVRAGCALDGCAARVSASAPRLCALTTEPLTDLYAYTRLRYVLTGRLPHGIRRRSRIRLECP